MSAQFDDNADGFEITGQDTPENIGAASVSVWFEQDDPSGSQVVVGLTRARTSRFIIYLENGLIRYQHGMERGGRLEGGIFENQPTLSNGWNNFVLTTSGNGEKISGYLNGQFLGDVSAGINLTGLTDYMIGAYTELAPADQYRQAFRGSIQNLRIYNRALSEQEVTTLYGIESQNTQFQIIEGNFTWQEAKADAEAKGGRLAVLDTQAKIDQVIEFLSSKDSTPSLLIGLSDEDVEGDWRWITGEPLIISNWGDGEPNNAGDEDYVSLHPSPNHPQPFFWNDGGSDGNYSYLLEILDQTPAVPFVAIEPLYESPSGESITLDATPTVGFPTEFTYQWCFNGFKIPANLGGTASSINIDNLQANEGTWSVSITNSEGIFEQDFEYRLYADSDSDGLSDAFEELISETDISKPDTDNDGLGDADEVNTYRTNPNSPDSDSDGFTDLYELETAYDPNSAESVPDALVNIMTAIEVEFNAALGATYAIEFSTDNQNWDIIEDDIVGEGGAVERLYSKQNFPTGFFRVERRDQ